MAARQKRRLYRQGGLTLPDERLQHSISALLGAARPEGGGSAGEHVAEVVPGDERRRRIGRHGPEVGQDLDAISTSSKT